MTSPLFDVSELIVLEQDLGKVPGVAVATITKVVVESGNSLRDTWKRNIEGTQGSPTAIPALASAVTAEPKLGLGKIGVQVGPEARGQGNLGRIHEYGTATSGAHMSGHQAADVEEPKFREGIQAAAIAALSGL